MFTITKNIHLDPKMKLYRVHFRAIIFDFRRELAQQWMNFIQFLAMKLFQRSVFIEYGMVWGIEAWS